MGKRKDIFKKTKEVCAHCGSKITFKTITMDHFVPKSYGGTLHSDNLFPLCKDCNKARGNEIVDPAKYYSFASQYSIILALNYLDEWKSEYTNEFYAYEETL